MNKYVNYLHYIKNLCLFKISLKKFPGNMKADYKNFIFFFGPKTKIQEFLEKLQPSNSSKT